MFASSASKELAITIAAHPLAAVEVGARRACWDEHVTMLLVHGHHTPGVGAAVPGGSGRDRELSGNGRMTSVVRRFGIEGTNNAALDIGRAVVPDGRSDHDRVTPRSQEAT